jgi:hypothetical protein
MLQTKLFLTILSPQTMPFHASWNTISCTATSTRLCRTARVTNEDVAINLPGENNRGPKRSTGSTWWWIVTKRTKQNTRWYWIYKQWCYKNDGFLPTERNCSRNKFPATLSRWGRKEKNRIFCTAVAVNRNLGLSKRSRIVSPIRRAEKANPYFYFYFVAFGSFGFFVTESIESRSRVSLVVNLTLPVDAKENWKSFRYFAHPVPGTHAFNGIGCSTNPKSHSIGRTARAHVWLESLLRKISKLRSSVSYQINVLNFSGSWSHWTKPVTISWKK